MIQIWILHDPILICETWRSRGGGGCFEFVTFGSEQSMRDAIEGMNGQDIDGCNNKSFCWNQNFISCRSS